MKNIYTLFLLASLLLFACCQNDISEQDPTTSTAGLVGAAEVINEEDELFEECLQWSRKVYEESNFLGETGPLLKVAQGDQYKPTRQVVAGMLFTFYWQTEEGKIIQIKIHIVPWMQGEERFPPLDNQVTVVA